jgi:aspartate/glutamate racemase
MYVITGKGTIAGVDLASYIFSKCQERGVLFDDDFPEYTLDFKTQLPSISKSIREGNTEEIITNLQKALYENERDHKYYILLCLTAHKLLDKLNTRLANINLWEPSLKRINAIDSEIAYLGTLESYPNPAIEKLVLHPSHVEVTSDLILSLKRGGGADSSKNILKHIYNYYNSRGIEYYFIACTDLHRCKDYLMELNVPEKNIIDIIELVGDKIIEIKGKKSLTDEMLGKIKDVKVTLKEKYSFYQKEI